MQSVLHLDVEPGRIFGIDRRERVEASVGRDDRKVRLSLEALFRGFDAHDVPRPVRLVRDQVETPQIDIDRLRGEKDVERFAAGAYMLALANGGAVTEQPNEALLSLLLYALSFTAYSDCAPLDLALCFAVRCLNILGYSPAITRCAACGRDLRAAQELHFSSAAGGALCAACVKGFMMDAVPVSALSLEAVRRMLLLSDQEMGKVRLPEQVRKELKYAINSYAEHALERRFQAFSCL